MVNENCFICAIKRPFRLSLVQSHYGSPFIVCTSLVHLDIRREGRLISGETSVGSGQIANRIRETRIADEHVVGLNFLNLWRFLFPEFVFFLAFLFSDKLVILLFI